MVLCGWGVEKDEKHRRVFFGINVMAAYSYDGLDDIAMDVDLSTALEASCKTTSPQSSAGKSGATGGFGHKSPQQTSPSSTDVVDEEEEVRLFAVSDIHVASAGNWEWMQNLSDTAYQRDALIVAGDASEDLNALEAALKLLHGKFGTVFFTPGNHDLWLSRADVAAGIPDSLSKIHAIHSICERLGVATTPRRIGTRVSAIRVAPLLSFHHQSFDTEPDIQGWNVPPADHCMTDYRNCYFAPPLDMRNDSVARAVDQLNDRTLAGGGGGATGGAANPLLSTELPLVSFSHFLPRIELLPEKRFLTCPPLAKAAGSAFLHARIRTLQPAVHVFGHTHFGWDATFEDDGVRYIQAALAYPTERCTRWHTLSVGAFGADGPLQIWSSVTGFAPPMHCRWSGYYQRHPREPHRVFELASYAAPGFQRTDSRATEVMPDMSHEDAPGVKAGVRMLPEDPALVRPPAGFS